MGKLAFVFSGQGAQYVGMGKELYENYPEVSSVFERANTALGFDIKALCFEGDKEILDLTENTQPAIVTVSMAIAEILNKKGIKPDIVAGLSLGEYSALVHSEAIEFEEAVRLVRKRGQYMQEAVPVGVGTMGAIIGLERSVVEEIIDEASSEGIVEGANYNCPGQIVVGGEVKAVVRALEIAKERGAAMAVQLSVSAPFHTSMLELAAIKLSKELGKINIKALEIPVIANVTAELHKLSSVKDMLSRQVKSPVMWEDSIRKLIEMGVDTFVEIGPGKALSGFIKKIDRKLTILNIEDMASLNKTLVKLEGVC